MITSVFNMNNWALLSSPNVVAGSWFAYGVSNTTIDDIVKNPLTTIITNAIFGNMYMLAGEWVTSHFPEHSLGIFPLFFGASMSYRAAKWLLSSHREQIEASPAEDLGENLFKDWEITAKKGGRTLFRFDTTTRNATNNPGVTEDEQDTCEEIFSDDEGQPVVCE